jgi:hypothetical protein
MEGVNGGSYNTNLNCQMNYSLLFKLFIILIFLDTFILLCV